MAVRIIYKAAAEAEIEEAYIAYETIRQGLGVEFLDELRRVENSPSRQSCALSKSRW